MTNKQRREHKIGNQQRKQTAIAAFKVACAERRATMKRLGCKLPPPSFSCIQDGNHSPNSNLSLAS